MKSLIGRRIIILMSIAIVSTSVLISLLGIYLSEDVISYLRGQEYVPDLSVLSEMTLGYMNDDLSKEVYTSILRSSEEVNGNLYYVYDPNGSLIYGRQGLVEEVDQFIPKKLGDVLDGETLFTRLEEPGQPMMALVGMPIGGKNQEVGAVFVAAEMVDMTQVRRDFMRSLILAIIIVMVFVDVSANIALRRIIKPVRNIMKVALAMTEGDFSIRADESLQGEIGLVGRTLNKLSIDLYKNVSQLYIEKNRLDHVLNSLEEGMVAVDESGKITHFNAELLEMFYLTQKPKSLREVPGVSGFEPEIMAMLAGHKSLNDKMMVGDYIYRIVGEPIENEHQVIVGAVILVSDITELENLETIRKNYVANVSHELRSPLTSIQGLIEPLMDNIVTNQADVKRYYNIIYEESRRLSRLVDDVMELSRLQISDVSIEKQVVDLVPTLLMVADRYRHIDKEIKLVYHQEALPLVLTNEDRIEQVLVILIDNAIKYMGGQGTIELTSEVRKTKIILSVKDTGMGIAQEHLPYIFDRFYKSDQARTKKSTGLGLSIAKEILDIMGEKIVCESQLGEGSVFSFSVGRDHVLGR